MISLSFTSYKFTSHKYVTYLWYLRTRSSKSHSNIPRA